MLFVTAQVFNERGQVFLGLGQVFFFILWTSGFRVRSCVLGLGQVFF